MILNYCNRLNCYPAISNYFAIERIPACAAFSYGQHIKCADLSELLQSTAAESDCQHVTLAPFSVIGFLTNFFISTHPDI